MRDKKHVFKRGLSLLLALVMCLSLIQVTAFAAEKLPPVIAKCPYCRTEKHFVAQVDPTCTKEGIVAHWTCESGKHNFYENTPNVEVAGQVKRIKPLGHKGVQDIPEIPAVCEKAGYTEGKYCPICETYIEGHKKIPALEHKSASMWVADSNSHWHTCTNLKADGTACGKVIDKAAHSYGRDGKCVCGLEHKHELVWTRHESDDGKHWQACSADECSYTTEQADHLSVGDPGVTYTNDGTTETWTCVCGKVIQQKGVCQHPGDYSFEDNIDGKTHKTTCKTCNKVLSEEESHRWDAAGTCLDCKAVCTHDWDGEGYCKICLTKCAHPANEMKWVQNNENTHNIICGVCDMTLRENEAHIYNQESATKCLCGAEKPGTPACKHSEAAKNHKDEVPATCTEDGMKAHYECPDCHQLFTGTGTKLEPVEEEKLVIPSAGHKYDKYEVTGTGGQHWVICSVCGDRQGPEDHVFVDGKCIKCGAEKPVKPVEPCNHKEFYWDNHDGKTHNVVCIKCEDVLEENVAHVYGASGVCVCGAKEPVQGGCEHTSHLKKVAAKAATCTQDGVQEHYECPDCGAWLVGRGTDRVEVDKDTLVIKAPGHDMQVDGEHSTAADCTKGGTLVKKCSRCDFTEKEEIPQKGTHTYGDKIPEKPATCKEPGMKAHYECTVCGKLFEGTHEVTAEKLTIPALGHTEVIDEAVAATCTETGLTEGKHCSVCGEVLVAQEVVPAAGHKYDGGETITIRDCNNGEAVRYTCTVCGDSYTQVGSPFGHEVVSYANVAATCTANGYTGGSYCSRCGSVITARTVIPATGHSWGAGVVTAQPTYYSTGVRTYTCAHDASHTYTETIPALTYPGGGGGGYNPVTPVTPVTPNVPVTPNNPVTNIPDPAVPQGNTPGGATTIEDESTPLGGISFVDVLPTDWFYEAVQYVFEKGLMLGVSDTEFGPNLSTTRGMIVTILYRMEGEPEAAASPFTDVEPGLWYSDAIGWGAANDIVNGYGDGRFGPNDQITREQMAAIFFRYAQYKGYDVTARADLSGYADADQISPYAVEAMQWAVGVKLIGGMTADTLAPKGQATRAQVAMMLMRFDKEIAAA